MKVKMISFLSGGAVEYAPGDIAEFDKEECERLISVGGAVAYVAPKKAASVEEVPVEAPVAEEPVKKSK